MQRAAIERVAAARGDCIEAWYAEKKSARSYVAQGSAEGPRPQQREQGRQQQEQRQGAADRRECALEDP
jgi:hypothetical protein